MFRKNKIYIGEAGSYRIFWFSHVSEHQNRQNRNFHFTGVVLGVALLTLGFITERYWLCLGLPLATYFFAAIGHYFFERNRPDTARHPLLSFVADIHMVLLMCARRMDREVRRMRVLRGH